VGSVRSEAGDELVLIGRSGDIDTIRASAAGADGSSDGVDHVGATSSRGRPVVARDASAS